MSKVNNIKNIIKKIDSIVLELKNKHITEENEIEDYFWDNHSDIMNDYPFLVCQTIAGSDRKMLDYMIQTLEQIETTIII